MTSEYIMVMFHEAMKITLMISAPLLLSSLISGLIISILQAATQVNEQTLSFIPKILSVISIISILGPWMLRVLTDYIYYIFNTISLITQ